MSAWNVSAKCSRHPCSVRLVNGLLLEAHGEGGDAYGSVDSAVHRLEIRVRRYKGRIKSHSSAAAAARRKVGVEAPDHIVSLSDDDQPEPNEANPLIIAEGQRNISHLTVSEPSCSSTCRKRPS